MALRMDDVSAELEMAVKTKLESEKGPEGQREGIGTQRTQRWWKRFCTRSREVRYTVVKHTNNVRVHLT
jgi:hypothetical protein